MKTAKGSTAAVSKAEKYAQREAQLAAVFEAIRKHMQVYASHFTCRVNRPGRYELWCEKPLLISGRKKTEVAFVTLITQSNYVGFYFMPICVDTAVQAQLDEQLLKLRKGMCCFHIKKPDEALFRDIETAMAVGFDCYKSRGWVEHD